MPRGALVERRCHAGSDGQMLVRCRMGTPDHEPRRERDETDKTLRAERTKTDEQLGKGRLAIEEEADKVLRVAQDRAEAKLQGAREHTDLATDATAAEEARRDAERAHEDRTLAEERATASELLRNERDQSERALHSLLRWEREATDERLVAERARADHVVSTRDDFLAMASHDLRSLLGGIALGAGVIAEKAGAAGHGGVEYLRQTERIQRFTARMNRLVGDLLDVVSLEAGQLRLNPGLHEVAMLLSEVDDTFQASFAGKGVTLKTHVPSGIRAAELDHGRVLQVLANLLSNALKFTDEGGEVTLSVAAVGSELVFSVSDTGTGIPQERAEIIFDRFQQGCRADRRGVGLGLYIAKSIVSAHKGRIWVESRVGTGSIFHFTIPRVADADSLVSPTLAE
jgi:signal transduction histidine kinase